VAVLPERRVGSAAVVVLLAHGNDCGCVGGSIRRDAGVCVPLAERDDSHLGHTAHSGTGAGDPDYGTGAVRWLHRKYGRYCALRAPGWIRGSLPVSALDGAWAAPVPEEAGEGAPDG